MLKGCSFVGHSVHSRREGLISPAGADEMPLSKAEVIELIQSHQPLFGLLDAARDPRILQLLSQTDAICESLYEGEKGAELARFAPYLVDLNSASSLLASLVEQGWGDSWGIFLSSAGVFADVRQHLRRFLMIKQPDGEQVYFRFYDPRVLRVFVPGLNAEERVTFFGPIDCFLLETEPPVDVALLRAAEK